MMYEASYFTTQSKSKVQCQLCPRLCIIDEDHFGNCHARRNRNGILTSEVYGKISSMNYDPIEKKPLYHFYPGSEILSIGTTGCNLHCVFCQNFETSQCNGRHPIMYNNLSCDELLKQVLKTKGNIGLAFTYNEPITNYEFVIDTARLIKQADLSTVLVTNGYINPDPLHMLLEYIDAFNIDLKGFNNNFYKKYTKATLQPVLESIKEISKSNKHLELTFLAIPTINDDEEEFENMCKWIVTEAGENTVLHISRYFPRYELNQYPTPPELLFDMYDMAKSYLKHVYLGNMATEIHSNTYCPKCNNKLIERTYYNIKLTGMDHDGCCKKCKTNVIKYI
jgi:pyruvate formate lyase activating enzyme